MDKTQNGKLTSGNNTSYWLDSAPAISFQPLKENKSTEVVIVGGGIAGVTTAYCLLKSGKKVVLVEDGNIASGETGRTTAHLVSALDDRYYELERIFGEDGAKIIADSHKSAIDFIEQTCLKENIACDFFRLPGYLFLHPSDSHDSLLKEFNAAKKAGIEVEMLDYLPGTKEKVQCIRFGAQAQFHPVKYISALCEAIQKMGGQIYTSTHADKIDHTGITTADGFRVDAQHVVVATNSPVNNKFAIHLKQYPHRTYVIGAKIKKGSVPRALWWDTGDFSKDKEIPPYHYIRTQPLDDTHDLLIIGGEDHQTGIADSDKINEQDRYSLVEYWAKNYFTIEEIVYTWSGQVFEPMDGIAFIGRNPSDKENVYVCTGDSGNGMTHGTIAGILITDLINGKENKWEKLYEPSRFKIFSAGKTFFKELAGGTLAYLKNKSHESKPVEVATIGNNEGKIIEVEKERFAAYRDENGQLHIVGAECTHLGCIIKWNNDEKSWDCPCHGSRFNHEGKVLTGPANKDLKYYSNK